MHEVAVDVDAARAVFVDEAVAVVVDALRIDRPPARLTLRRVRALHEARVLGADHVQPFGVLHAHDRDDAVLVEVLGAVFVHPGVVVRVERRCVGATQRLDWREHQLRTVGVDARQDVDDRRVQALLHRGVSGVRAGQVVHGVQRQFAANQVIAFEVRGHEQRGPALDWRALGVGDLDSPDVAPFPRLADGREAHEVRVRGRGRLQRSRELLVGVVLRGSGLGAVDGAPPAHRGRSDGRPQQRDTDTSPDGSHALPPRLRSRNSSEATTAGPRPCGGIRW